MTYRSVAMAAVFGLSVLAARAARPCAVLEDGSVIVASSRLVLTMRAGAVTGLRDRSTGEVFATPADPGEGLRELFGDQPPSRPRPDAGCDLRVINSREAEAIYRDLTPEGAGELRYRIRVERGTGAILLRASVHAPADADSPLPNIPLVGFRPASVILGSGARYVPTDPPVVDSAQRAANNLYSPPVAVVEGTRSCVFLWARSFRGLNNVRLDHRTDHDNLLLTTARDYQSPGTGVVHSVTWRIEPCESWLDAARRYRAAFERATGAHPLWRNPTPWVRRIHAVHTDAPGGGHGSPTPEQADSYYAELAQVLDPAALLLFYWNGNGIVMFGDHRYMTRLGWPKQPARDALRKHGFRWMGYHPYVLIMAPSEIEQRLARIVDQKWGLPEGYVFTPDYGGPAEGFYEHVRPVAHGYYQGERDMDEMTGLWVLHPGSRRTRDYLLHNLVAYCEEYGMSGCYLDILGVGAHNWEFPEDRKVMDGHDGCGGEAAFLRELRAAHPELAVMSECQSEWTTAGTFYTWEGASHFLRPRAYDSIKTKLNHPLRTALWGSYTWTRQHAIDPAEVALVGALPRLVLSDEWSVARAKLFVDEGLFNDLPDEWPEGVLACYRGRGNRRFQFRALPYGDGFVELVSSASGWRPFGRAAGAPEYRPRLVRLHGQSHSPFERAARIQGWPAYRDGRPIGLNPARTYPLLFEEPRPEGRFRVTALPDNAHLQAVRPGEGHSVLEFGVTGGGPVTGEVTAILHRACDRICGPDGDLAGPFEAGRELRLPAALPGGWVLAWTPPKPAKSVSAIPWTRATGHTLAAGMPDYRGWCYNSGIRNLDATVGDTTSPALAVGPGRYRGYAEGWAEVPAGGAPALRFEIGYAPADAKARPPRPLLGGVQINGSTVWQEEFAAAPEWRAQEVDLRPYAGRTVLITLTAGQVGGREHAASPGDPPLLFGRVRLEAGP